MGVDQLLQLEVQPQHGTKNDQGDDGPAQRTQTHTAQIALLLLQAGLVGRKFLRRYGPFKARR